MIQEISRIALSSSFGLAHGIPHQSKDALSTAITSIQFINRKTLSRTARAIHTETRQVKWNLSLERLKAQRKYSDACSLEKKNRVWNRIMDNLSPGQRSFLLQAASDTLPTPLNLRQWGFRVDSKCTLCGSAHPTVLHILNACPTSLNQGRFTWRHDSVLQTVIRGVMPTVSADEKLYADLAGYRACDNPPATIPEDILATTARPDVVIVREKEIILVELTIPYNSPKSLRNARQRKRNKENYQLALSELDRKEFKASLVTLEIGALGHSLLQTHSDLKKVLPNITRSKIKQLFDEAARISIACSHSIFRARTEVTWNSNRALQS